MIENKLYLCATPIGNLEDITLRVLRVLNEVDFIYCEDTRHTLGLLNHFEIKKPLISCHEHNELTRAQEVIDKINSGSSIAFVSDAGMPAISDPGARLVTACIESNVPFEVLPGASAVLLSAIYSGLDCNEFMFIGFLSRIKKERNEKLKELKNAKQTIIFYESPLRVKSTLSDLYDAFGDRRCAVVRELTKLHEQAVRGTISELIERYKDEPPRGECVIVLEGAKEVIEKNEQGIEEIIKNMLESGMSAKDAAKEAASIMNVSKNEAYKIALELKA